jgi:hypothetical protein
MKGDSQPIVAKRTFIKGIVMTAAHTTPLLYVAPALREKFLPWVCLGVFLGLANLLLWSKDHPKTLAIEVWGDNVAMPTFSCLAIFLLVTGALSFPFRNHPLRHRMAVWVTPFIKALTKLAAVGFQVTSGMALVGVCSGVARHAPLFILFLLYLVALPEITTGLWKPQGLSRSAPFLLSIMMSAPVIAPIL